MLRMTAPFARPASPQPVGVRAGGAERVQRGAHVVAGGRERPLIPGLGGVDEALGGLAQRRERRLRRAHGGDERLRLRPRRSGGGQLHVGEAVGELLVEVGELVVGGRDLLRRARRGGLDLGELAEEVLADAVGRRDETLLRLRPGVVVAAAGEQRGRQHDGRQCSAQEHRANPSD